MMIYTSCPWVFAGVRGEGWGGEGGVGDIKTKFHDFKTARWSVYLHLKELSWEDVVTVMTKR